jgi:tetratricopeptide (TPR) repeat protein
MENVAELGNIQSAQARLDAGDLTEAEQLARAALEVRPFHPAAALLLGHVAQAAGDTAQARQWASLAATWAPRWTTPRELLTSLNAEHRPEVPPHQNTPRLTICLIAKNEERFLGQCLASVRGLANQIVVVDTGSTDRTVDLAREFGAEVHHFAWTDDFSAARNVALSHARGSWVLVLDADEELPPDQHAHLLRDLDDTEAAAFRLPIINVGDDQPGANYVPRLFRNVPGAHFVGRIHEQVFSSVLAVTKPWGLSAKLGIARLWHHGYTAEVTRERGKVERNLRLLRQATGERPADANLRLNLGLELVRSGELEAGLDAYRATLELLSAQPPGEVVPELRETLLSQFTTHLFKAGRSCEVVALLRSPLATTGGLTASLDFALGLAHFERREFREAARHLRRCIAHRHEPGLTPGNPDIHTAVPSHCLALSLIELGDSTAAEVAFRDGLANGQKDESLRLDYARFLTRKNRPIEALELLNATVAANAGCAAAWKLGGELALSRPEYLEFARDWTAEALKAIPADLAVQAQRAEALLLSNDAPVALEVWRPLAASNSAARLQAAWLLCELVAGPTAVLPAPPDEPAVSRAFLEWYRRLIAFGAGETVQRLHDQLAALRRTLPGAAGVVAGVMAQLKS